MDDLLDVARIASGKAPAEPSHPAATRLNGTRVLIVDDDAESREIAAAIIGSAGGVVTTAKSAAEGLASALDTPPDVVICDIGMAYAQRGCSVAPSNGSTRHR